MDDLQKDARSLRLYVRKMLSDSGETNLLLVVDQFEETFTLCKDLTERKAFIENLLSLADEDGASAAAWLSPCARISIITARNTKACVWRWRNIKPYIGAMTPDELRQAITAPAENTGWDFQPGLVDLILQDVGTEPGALPLLSHALLETWKRRQGRTLTLQGYADAGGVKKAIAQTAESVYDHLSPAEQTIARGIFLRLTELGEGVQDTRRRAKLDELSQATRTGSGGKSAQDPDRRAFGDHRTGQRRSGARSLDPRMGNPAQMAGRRPREPAPAPPPDRERAGMAAPRTAKRASYIAAQG